MYIKIFDTLIDWCEHSWQRCNRIFPPSHRLPQWQGPDGKGANPFAVYSQVRTSSWHYGRVTGASIHWEVHLHHHSTFWVCNYLPIGQDQRGTDSLDSLLIPTDFGTVWQWIGTGTLLTDVELGGGPCTPWRFPLSPAAILTRDGWGTDFWTILGWIKLQNNKQIMDMMIIIFLLIRQSSAKLEKLCHPSAEHTAWSLARILNISGSI